MGTDIFPIFPTSSSFVALRLRVWGRSRPPLHSLHRGLTHPRIFVLFLHPRTVYDAVYTHILGRPFTGSPRVLLTDHPHFRDAFSDLSFP